MYFLRWFPAESVSQSAASSHALLLLLAPKIFHSRQQHHHHSSHHLLLQDRKRQEEKCIEKAHSVVPPPPFFCVTMMIRSVFALLLTAGSAVAFRSSFIQGNNAFSSGVRSQSSLCMKTIAVFGASGLTASECVYQALKEGDNVVGLTRNPSNLKIPAGSGGSEAGKTFTDSKLTMIAGDATKKEDVDKVFETPIDGVIVALGGKTADVGKTMLTDGTTNVINAMKEKGVKRLAVVTSIGAGNSKDQAPFLFKVLMSTVMKSVFEDKNKQEEVTANSGLEYCIVRPGGLTVSEPTGIINVVDGEAGSIARADVAQFCLDAVNVEDFPYIGKSPCISSVGGTSWTKDRSKAARGEMA